MFHHIHERRWHYPLLIVAAGLLFLTNLGGASLWDLDEGRNAEAAFEMLESRNWTVPTFNAQLRADKPVLLYWLQVAAYQVFGINEFSARLPSALAALITVLVCYELARTMFGATSGFLAGFVAATTPMLCGAARFANPDALLNLFTALTLTLFWLGRGRAIGWYIAIGVAAGMALLAKGPVGFVLPATVIGFFILWHESWRRIFDRRWTIAISTMLLVALPWYILVTVDTRGNFLRGFLWRHNVERFNSAFESHGGSPLFYPLVLLIGMAPWTIFCGPALWYGFWSALREPSSRWQPYWRQATEGERGVAAYRFLACWSLTYLLFFTVAATKLPNYVLPVLVPCSILLARFLDRWRRAEIRLSPRIVPISLVCLALIGVGLSAGLALAAGVWPLPVFRGRFFPALSAWALLGICPLAGALTAALCYYRQQRTGLILCVAGSALLLLVPLAAYGSALFNQYKAPQLLVDAAAALQRDQEIRVGAWQLEHLPSLNFYVRRDVVVLHDEAEALAFLNYPVPVYLFLPAEDWERLGAMAPATARVLGRQRDMYHHRDVVVVTNR
jgi:4-amino-4-deoxy-L-arabinose transferase-like glycosyltransferase